MTMTPPPLKKKTDKVSFYFVLAECQRDSDVDIIDSEDTETDSEDDSDYFLEGIDPVFE